MCCLTVLTDTADVVDTGLIINCGAARVSGVGKADSSDSTDPGLSHWWSYLLYILFLLGL